MCIAAALICVLIFIVYDLLGSIVTELFGNFICKDCTTTFFLLSLSSIVITIFKSLILNSCSDLFTIIIKPSNDSFINILRELLVNPNKFSILTN